MLTKVSALRLHRSALPSRFDAHHRGDMPSTAPENQLRSGSAKHPSGLEVLVKVVLADGPRQGPRCNEPAVAPWKGGGGGLDSLSPPYMVSPRSTTSGHSFNHRGGQPLHCVPPLRYFTTSVWLSTRVVETVKWLVELQLLCLMGGRGNKTEYDQAYEPGEGVSHQVCGLVRSASASLAGPYFLTLISYAGRSKRAGQCPFPSLFLHILGRPSPAFLLLTHS